MISNGCQWLPKVAIQCFPFKWLPFKWLLFGGHQPVSRLVSMNFGAPNFTGTKIGRVEGLVQLARWEFTFF